MNVKKYKKLINSIPDVLDNKLIGIIDDDSEFLCFSEHGNKFKHITDGHRTMVVIGEPYLGQESEYSEVEYSHLTEKEELIYLKGELKKGTKK